MNITLDPDQSSAAYAEGHCLVTAVPGAGKTRMLAARGAYLLNSTEGRLAAVTFTREGAKELKTRILEYSGGQSSRRTAVGTFHSLAYGQLKRDQTFQMPQLLNHTMRTSMIRRAMGIARVYVPVEEAMQQIDAYKASMAPPPDPATTSYAAVFHEYQKLLAQHNTCDFSDYLMIAVREMKAGTLAPLPVSHMLVDEGQDMDEVQYAWVCCHSENGTEVTIVGDEDQTIFAWRHAMGFEGFRRFQDDHPAVHVIMDTSYRCRPEILECAERLIGQNSARFDKRLLPVQEAGGIVKVECCADRKDEQFQAAVAVSENPVDWAILARTNRYLDGVEISLRTLGVPYVRIGGSSIWESRQAGLFLGLLSALRGRDKTGYTAVLQGIGIKPAVVEIAAVWFEQLLAGHAKAQCPNGVSQDEERQSRTFSRLCGQWIELLKTGRIELAVSAIGDWLSKVIRGGKPEVYLWLSEGICQSEGTLDQRVMNLTLPKKVEGANCVTLMTLHASKGLEFPKVWILGVVSGVLPHADGDMEEERRLMYVGVTRAKDELHLSYALDEAGGRSPFIREMGDDLV